MIGVTVLMAALPEPDAVVGAMVAPVADVLGVVAILPEPLDAVGVVSGKPIVLDSLIYPAFQ